jgi:hypothetical protein
MTNHEPPPGAVAPLEILPGIAAAWRLVLGDAGALVRILLLPALLSLVISGIALSLADPWGDILWHFALLLPWTVLCVTWLRRCLDLEKPARTRFFPVLDGRHLRFLKVSFFITLIDLPLWLLPRLLDDGAADAIETLQDEIFSWALYALRIYVELRFAYAYVASAADESYSLAFAFRHTRGQSLRLFAIVVVAVILPWRAFSYILGQSGLPYEIIEIAWHASLWFMQGVYMTCVALAFRRSTGWVPPPDRTILERFE